MKITLSGRIEKMQPFTSSQGRGINTLLSVPAADPYSRPQQFKIISDQPLGQIGQEVSVSCELSGYVKSRSYTDKKTNLPAEFWEGSVSFRSIGVASGLSPVSKAS